MYLLATKRSDWLHLILIIWHKYMMLADRTLTLAGGARQGSTQHCFFNITSTAFHQNIMCITLFFVIQYMQARPWTIIDISM